MFWFFDLIRVGEKTEKAKKNFAYLQFIGSLRYRSNRNVLWGLKCAKFIFDWRRSSRLPSWLGRRYPILILYLTRRLGRLSAPRPLCPPWKNFCRRRRLLLLLLSLGDTWLQTDRHRQLVVSHRPRYIVHLADCRSAIPHRQRASASGTRHAACLRAQRNWHLFQLRQYDALWTAQHQIFIIFILFKQF